MGICYKTRERILNMNSLQKNLFELILETNLQTKIALGLAFSQKQAEPISALSLNDQKFLKSPGRPKDFQTVSPRNVPKRNFEDLQQRANFLHAIGNIELLAVELPALCLLRFGSDDLDFIQKQFHIIAEEAYHFSMIKSRLHKMGIEFGSLPAHNGLWDHAWRCQNELEHQILIPCYLEARGLDVSPTFIEKLDAVKDQESAEILRIILRDEIGHVKTGQEYLSKKAKNQNTEPAKLFRKTLETFFGDQLKSKVPINKKTRLEAGFDQDMLNLIS